MNPQQEELPEAIRAMQAANALYIGARDRVCELMKAVGAGEAPTVADIQRSAYPEGDHTGGLGRV